MSKLLTIGLVLTAKDLAGRVLRDFGATADRETARARSGFQRLGEAIDRASGRMTALGTGARLAGDAIVSGLSRPLQAYTRLDEATTDLRVAMLDNTGRVGAGFEAIQRQAVELGNVLPGTAADFMGVGTALMEQGTALVLTKPRNASARSYRFQGLSSIPKTLSWRSNGSRGKLLI